MPDHDTPPPTFSGKLDRLFKVVRPTGEDREYTYKEVAAAISDRGGPPTTANYLYLLRTGRRDNPGKKLLEALADFFRINVSYFYDTGPASEDLEDDLRLVAALRNSQVRQLALRSLDLSPGNLTHIMGIIDQVRALEGLPRGTPPPPQAWTGEDRNDDRGEEREGADR